MPRSSESSTDHHRCDDSGRTGGRLDWHTLALGDSLTNAATLEQIATEFVVLQRGHDSRIAAVLQRLDTSHSMHCEVTVYFSPATAALARRLHATACSRPDVRGLSIVAGNAERWRDLFEDQ